MASRALGDGMVCGSTQHSRTAHGLVLMISGGSTSILRHRTRAALAVLSFPGAEPRQGKSLAESEDCSVGFPTGEMTFDGPVWDYGKRVWEGLVRALPLVRFAVWSRRPSVVGFDEGSEVDVYVQARSVRLSDPMSEPACSLKPLTESESESTPRRAKGRQMNGLTL